MGGRLGQDFSVDIERITHPLRASLGPADQAPLRHSRIALMAFSFQISPQERFVLWNASKPVEGEVAQELNLQYLTPRLATISAIRSASPAFR